MGVAIVVDSALVLGLGELLAPRTWVRLFRNDREVASGSTLLDFEPCLFPGYADIELTALWPAPAIRGAGQAWSGEIPLLWTRGPGGVADTAYGWVVYQDPDPSSVLLAGRRVPRPWPMIVEGQQVSFNLSSYLIRGY